MTDHDARRNVDSIRRLVAVKIINTPVNDAGAREYETLRYLKKKHCFDRQHAARVYSAHQHDPHHHTSASFSPAVARDADSYANCDELEAEEDPVPLVEAVDSVTMAITSASSSN